MPCGRLAPCGGRGSRAIVSLENKFSFPRKRYASVVLSFFALILDAIHKGGLRSIERAVQSCAIYRGNDSTVFQGYRTRSRCDQGRSFRIDRGKPLSPPCNAPRSLFPDFFLFSFSFLSVESMNFETRIRAYLPIIANFFLIFQLREGDILSEHSFSFPSRRGLVPFL